MYVVSGQDKGGGEVGFRPAGCASQKGHGKKRHPLSGRPRFAAGGLVVSLLGIYDFVSIFDPAKPFRGGKIQRKQR